MTEPTSSMPQVVAPLILDARDELMFFPTPAHLETFVEAIDVVNDEYGGCWDSEGRLLRLTVQERPARVLGLFPVRREVVCVEAAEDNPTHGPELHLALLRHLSACNLGADMPTNDKTADLLALAIEHTGWS